MRADSGQARARNSARELPGRKSSNHRRSRRTGLLAPTSRHAGWVTDEAPPRRRRQRRSSKCQNLCRRQVSCSMLRSSLCLETDFRRRVRRSATIARLNALTRLQFFLTLGCIQQTARGWAAALRRARHCLAADRSPAPPASYPRLVGEWVVSVDLDAHMFGARSLRRTTQRSSVGELTTSARVGWLSWPRG